MGPFLLLHPNDNVLVCREHAFKGQSIVIDGETAMLGREVEVGHKIARHALRTGDKVIKYGAPIGSMTADTARGEHIHMHNMRSDYISSHTREVTGHGH